MEPMDRQDTSIDTRIVINVGGVKHETYRSTLYSIPDTRLYWLLQNPASRNCVEYDSKEQFFFFDRHPGAFEQIINFYRTGKLHCPMDLCGPMFEEELIYWGIDEKQIEPCCWNSYTRHRDAKATIAAFEGKDALSTSEETDSDVAEKFGIAEKRSQKTRWQIIQPRIWTLLDDPYSSSFATVLTGITMTLIVLSVIGFCLETHPLRSWTFSFSKSGATKKTTPSQGSSIDKSYLSSVINSTDDIFHEDIKEPERRVSSEDSSNISLEMSYILTINDQICSVWFTIELLCRIIFCPNKRQFLKTWLNIVDILAVIPFYFQTIFHLLSIDKSQTFLSVIEITKILRIIRVFKLVRHFIGLKVLVHTLRASAKELLLLIVFLVMGVIVFSSLMFYAEGFGHLTSEVSFKNEFETIPAGFWWALVTMTTIGYGDSVPKTWSGRIIGALCAISGVLTIALPVPVIVNNFTLYYNHAQARLKLPKKKKATKLAAAAPAFKSLKHLALLSSMGEPIGGEDPEGQPDNSGSDTENQDSVSVKYLRRRSGHNSQTLSVRKLSPYGTEILTDSGQSQTSLTLSNVKSTNTSLINTPSIDQGCAVSPISYSTNASSRQSLKDVARGKRKQFNAVNRRYSITQAQVSQGQRKNSALKQDEAREECLKKSTSFTCSTASERNKAVRSCKKHSWSRSLLKQITFIDDSSDSEMEARRPKDDARKLQPKRSSINNNCNSISKPPKANHQRRKKEFVNSEKDGDLSEGIGTETVDSSTRNQSQKAKVESTGARQMRKSFSEPQQEAAGSEVGSNYNNHEDKDEEINSMGHNQSFKKRTEISQLNAGNHEQRKLSMQEEKDRGRISSISGPVDLNPNPIKPANRKMPWLQRQTSYSEVDTRSRRRNSFVPQSMPLASKDNSLTNRERLRHTITKITAFDSVKETNQE